MGEPLNAELPLRPRNLFTEGVPKLRRETPRAAVKEPVGAAEMLRRAAQSKQLGVVSIYHCQSHCHCRNRLSALRSF